MTHTGLMILPQNAIGISENEGRTLNGGYRWTIRNEQISITNSKEFLSKSVCLSAGAYFRGYKNMSKTRIAQEIYAHAMIYYKAISAKRAKKQVNASVVNYLLKHGKTIELGGDSKLRVLAYETIWVKN